MSTENTPSLAQKLRGTATYIEQVSEARVGIEKFEADYIFASIPLVTLVGGMFAGGGGKALLNESGFFASLIALGSSLSGIIAANFHGDDEMRASEWIGPSVARGLRIGANITEAFGSLNR